MKVCFDLDGVLCHGRPYAEAVPDLEAIEYLRHLYDQGHIILIYTARGMGGAANNVGRAVACNAMLTLEQLDLWNIPYDEVLFGKPTYDILIDDKSVSNLEQLKHLMGTNHVYGIVAQPWRTNDTLSSGTT